MLTKDQMKHVEGIFSMAKSHLFEDGFLSQVFFVIEREKALILPVPQNTPLSASIALDLMNNIAELKGCELVLYISEAWVVKEEIKGTFKDIKEHIAPRECKNKKEVILMSILEAKGDKEVHMKLGYIEHDDQGGAYVKEEEWMPSGGTITPIRRSQFSDTFNA